MSLRLLLFQELLAPALLGLSVILVSKRSNGRARRVILPLRRVCVIRGKALGHNVTLTT